MGTGFKEYLIGLRIEKAKTMLCSGKYNVGEIAEKIGYGNSSFFIKNKLDIDPDALVGDLSVGVQQRVEIIKLLAEGFNTKNLSTEGEENNK